jgi:hypothetical protein
VDGGGREGAGDAGDRLASGLANCSLDHAGERVGPAFAQTRDLGRAKADAAGDSTADQAVDGRVQGLLGVPGLPVALEGLQALDGQVQADALDQAHDRAPDEGFHEPPEDRTSHYLGRGLGYRNARQRGAESLERQGDEHDDLDRRDDEHGDEHVLRVLDLQSTLVEGLAEHLAGFRELHQKLGIGLGVGLPVGTEPLGGFALDHAQDLGR